MRKYIYIYIDFKQRPGSAYSKKTRKNAPPEDVHFCTMSMLDPKIRELDRDRDPESVVHATEDGTNHLEDHLS